VAAAAMNCKVGFEMVACAIVADTTCTSHVGKCGTPVDARKTFLTSSATKHCSSILDTKSSHCRPSRACRLAALTATLYLALG
jgi:hypothetical protein